MNIKKILLMGNPNVGKSTIFSRLTGASIVISNYPGSTVEFTQGNVKIGDKTAVMIDVPGTYTLEPTSKAEEVAVHMLEEGDLVINVVDATNLERNLYLTLEILEKGMPVIVVLNMWDETKHQGIHIDVAKLKEALGVSVIPVCGLTGEGIKELIVHLPEARPLKVKIFSDKHKWERIGRIIENVQRLTHHHHTLLQRLEEVSIKPLTGVPIALGIIYAAFCAIRFIGENLITFIFEPLFNILWLPLMLKLSTFLGGTSFLHHVVIGNLIGGTIDFGQSFGVLTTGLFVPVAMVLPYILSFYLILGILEDFGYLPRLAVMVDNLMHHLGLHGYAIIPMMLGLGCNVPGALAIRLLEGRREKFIAATLMAIAVPCMAQIAMIVGLVGQRGGRHLAVVFITLFLLLVIKGLILNKLIKGSSPEILIEIPPYRLPQPLAVFKKLWMRVCGFLKEAVPYVLLGILFVNILYALHIIEFFGKLLAPLFTKIWGLPQEAISALIVGFLRKDVAVGMLAPLNLSTKQLIIGSTILTIYFPCIATFAVLVREIGIRDMLKAAGIMIFMALTVGAILNMIL
ncbi:FeoB small GTPase domain-containing protein [Candidatus Omnitrophota bacterium]